MTTTPTTPSTPGRARLWLIIGSALAVLGVAALWPLREVGQVCAAIYPPPPGCGSPVPAIAVWVGIGAIIALVCIMVVIALTAPQRWPLVIVAAALVVVVTLIAWSVVALSQTGIWDAPVDPIPLALI